MSKCVLIIGAGLLQLPAFIKAREMGLRILAIDKDPNAPGMAMADEARAIDTRDEQGAIEFARLKDIDGVMTLCTDFPIRTVAAVADELGLPGLDRATALRATDKRLMRQAFEKHGAPSPRFRVVRHEVDAKQVIADLGLPVIVKPTSSSGSCGVFKIEREEQVGKGFAHAMSVSGAGEEILVEEFVGGHEVSVEIVSFDGRHHVLAITDKFSSGDPYWVELGHVQPSRLPQNDQEQIIDAARRGLDALGVMNCASHVEVKVGNQGARLIEIGARLGGDFISTELVLRSTGISMPKAALQLALGEQPDLQLRYQRGSAIRYIIPPPGEVVGIDGIDRAKRIEGVAVVDVYVKKGDHVGGFSSSWDRAGHVIAEGEHAAEAEQRAMAAVSEIEIETTGTGS